MLFKLAAATLFVVTLTVTMPAVAQDTPVPPQPPTLFPAWAPMIQPADRPATYATGSVAKNMPIATLPFTYRHTLKTRSEINYEIFGLKYLPAGSYGFVAGNFDALYGSELDCFFKDGNYVVPHCLYHRPSSPSGMIDAQPAGVRSNIPLIATSATGIFKFPEPEHDVTIDHDFALSMAVVKWHDGKADLVWKSDGGIVTSIRVSPGTDGFITFATPEGLLKLRADPDVQDATLVTLEPAQ